MSKQLSIICLVLFSSVFTALTSYTQEPRPPKKVESSVGIYDVKSADDIHKLSGAEIQKLVKMEDERSRWVPHPVLVYCFEARDFRYTGGKFQDRRVRYRLHVPKTIRYGKKYPLVIHLHGIGQAGSDNSSSLVHLHSVLPLMIGTKQQDFFLLVVQCPKATPGWSFQSTKDGTLDILMAAMEHVIADNPIDKKRITVTGVSSGGYGVWELLKKYPDVFAGAVPTACNAPPPSQQLAALTKTPIWAFRNKSDGAVDSEKVRATMQFINGSGGSMAFTECDAPGHNAWRPAMSDYNCFQWMLSQKKGSWFSPPPGVIVHFRLNPAWLVFAIYVLPLSIIVFFLRGTLVGLATTVYQFVKRRVVKN